MPRSEEAYLLDILNSAHLIVAFMEDIDYPSFINDAKTQSAVLHQLLLMGEAVKHISNGFKSSHQPVQWKDIAGMRDKLIHEYHKVDIDEVWNTVTSDIPRLIDFLTPLIPPEDQAV
ncbi:DUF86 domain-containing protein [bacterium]|nr:DUF86 domain-containing protein [bacterium]